MSATTDDRVTGRLSGLLRSRRLWVWAAPFALYAAFWLWYTPLGGPLSSSEVSDIVAELEERGYGPDAVARMRSFFEDDDGRSFVMVNVIDVADSPPELPATGPGASGEDLLAHYMEYMWPALFSRASHPLFSGVAVGPTLDVVGIENAERWGTGALMRYRSRRDMWAISSHPSFAERHEYKVAALEKTIAYPVRTQFQLGDPRFVLFLMLVAALGVIDAAFLRQR